MFKKSLIILVILICSCEGIFHEDDTKYVVPETEQEKIDLLNGIYYHLVNVHNSYYLMMMVRADDVNYYTNTNFWEHNEEGGSRCRVGDYPIDMCDKKDEIFLNLYRAIINANLLILQLKEEQDAAIIGEAYFLRAYCYFKLARFFGQPPLVKDIEVNYLLEKPEYIDVYEFIESDLLQALELLPESYRDVRIPGETPNQGTSKALLAEVYLTMAGYPVNDVTKYAEAARLAGEVMEHADFYNYALLDDMGNLWKTAYRRNTENIFGLFFSGDNRKNRNYFGANRVSYYNGLIRYQGRYTPEFKFFNDYPYNYRKYISLKIGEYISFGIDTLAGEQQAVYFYPYDPLFDPCSYVYGGAILKWLDMDQLKIKYPAGYGHEVYSNVTLYLLRYAHTLLTYAEASARSGNLDASCYEAVNMIRRRANKVDLYSPSEFDLTNGLTTEQFLDSVVWERAWELCCEPDGRWFDIIRLDLRDKLPDYRYSTDKPYEVEDELIGDDWYFYLIPEEDRWQNPNYGND